MLDREVNPGVDLKADSTRLHLRFTAFTGVGDVLEYVIDEGYLKSFGSIQKHSVRNGQLRGMNKSSGDEILGTGILLTSNRDNHLALPPQARESWTANAAKTTSFCRYCVAFTSLRLRVVHAALSRTGKSRTQRIIHCTGLAESS